MKENNKEDIIYNLTESAVRAALYEVSSYPSPGLVSPISRGAHKDMDFYTFIDSTSSLIKPFMKFAEIGYCDKDQKEIFDNIRLPGRFGEELMLKRTKGVNAHRGLLFILGITIAAVSNTLYNGGSFSEIKNTIIKMTYGIVDKELKNINKYKKLTHGEKLFIDYGVTGIRGEAEKGFPLVFENSLRVYKEAINLGERERMVHTLISIMQFCEDTTILHRHSFEVLKYVQEKSRNILSLGGMYTSEGKESIYSLDKDFIERNISPGGSADLLALTVFLSDIEDKLYFAAD
ncbi:triphosphoribosyl-dephospho-CoA synthase CitG [Clostridium polynesiense]|uniref:triphosphoribosyl-dephospho-CoA synthase CitG n=1 Tax=Clostridium polynesiense TaxID=1325933 RepID=UPI00058C3636|nr:triphosphoribosyl-dephospho-CoA synthase CitG [Clostridium polynesiense]